MRTRFGPALVAAVLALGIATPVLAGGGVAPLEPLQPPPAPIEGFVEETTDRWFVEMPSAPTVDGTALAVTRVEKAAFRSAAKKAGLRYTERYAFDRLWNGLSITMEPSQLAVLARVSGVKAIYPVGEIPLPATTPGDPELYTALAMTGADVAQSELGYTGTGVKVAVMDTGVDVDHPDLGGGFGPGYRVAYGYDFVGDAYNADATSPTYNPVPVPDADPDDCNGHGTHVAGIVGANGTVKGVAPDVTFGAYRVFGCEGSTESDIMIAAMERAYADGMQVLNMSIGSAYQWPQYPTAMAATRLVNSGVVVVASIGNNGTNGLYAAGAPGLGEKVIGVASYDNTHVTLTTFTVSPDDTAVGYIAATGAPLPPTSGTFAMAKTGTTSTPDDGCNPLPPGSLAGKVALIRRGTCTFYLKASNAQAAGAAGVVLYNNAAGMFSPTVAGTPAMAIPVVAVSAASGALLDGRIASGPTDLTWTDQTGSFPDANGGLISSFSSYGLSPDLALKPDIGAPGGNIYSTYPLEKGSYATLGGTSMASPHVAGAAALLLQAKPQTPAQAVRSILQNSADPAVWWGGPALGFLDDVHRQGAGMLDIDDAILATTKVEPGKLSLGESELGPVTRTLKIENRSMTAVTYDLTYVNALSTGGIISPMFFTSDATAVFSAPFMTVPAFGTAWVDVTITAPTGPNLGQYGGYLVFTPQGGGQVYRVPFAGFVGDYQAIPVLTSGGYGFPWLAVLDGGSYYRLTGPADWTFTMVGGDVPYVLVHLDHQAAQMKVEVFEASTGKSWHLMHSEKYLARSSTASAFFSLTFNGTTTAGKKTYTVPDGTYLLKLSVLKALGDPANPMHWETWTSPVFVIDRP